MLDELRVRLHLLTNPSINPSCIAPPTHSITPCPHRLHIYYTPDTTCMDGYCICYIGVLDGRLVYHATDACLIPAPIAYHFEVIAVLAEGAVRSAYLITGCSRHDICTHTQSNHIRTHMVCIRTAMHGSRTCSGSHPAIAEPACRNRPCPAPVPLPEDVLARRTSDPRGR